MSDHSNQRLKSLLFDFPFGILLLASGLCLPACAKYSQEPCVEADCQLMQSQETIEPEYRKAALLNVELGLNYLSQEQIARAKHKLMYAVKLAPNAVEPHSALAYFFEKVGDIKEAELEHKKALRLGTTKGALANNYAAFLYRQNRHKEAKQAFARALQDKQYAHSAAVNENAGLCALALSEFVEAENYFNTAIQEDPKREQALLSLAALKLKQKDLATAKALLQRHKTLDKPSAKAVLLNIEVATLEKDKKRAAANAAELKTFFSDSPEYQQYLLSEAGGGKK
jgi:type IV pilus assembly protein PilF